MPSRPRSAEDDASFLGMGKVVAEARKRRGLDEYEFAEVIGEDVRTVRRLESGKVNADWAALRIVARALDLPLDVLIDLAESAAPGEGGEQWRRWSREAEVRRDHV